MINAKNQKIERRDATEIAVYTPNLDFLNNTNEKEFIKSTKAATFKNRVTRRRDSSSSEEKKR